MFGSPRDALARGVTMIAQEPALVPARSVIENVFLGLEPRAVSIVRQGELRRRFESLIERTGIEMDPQRTVRTLSLADRQKVSILQAVAREAELIVMDEPTASLTMNEAERLFNVVRTLADRGTTIVYVSHALDEVLRLVDTVTTLKDGRVVRTAPAGRETTASLVAGMLGESLDEMFPVKSQVSPEAASVLEIESLRRSRGSGSISLAIKRGEIVGIAGLGGSGRTELARAIFGAPPPESGTIRVNGERVVIRSPRDAIRAGIALLPEDRKSQGLLMRRSIADNVTLPHLYRKRSFKPVRPRTDARAVKPLVQHLNIRTDSLSTHVESLSGGNQQKVLFAKWLLEPPHVLIADEPTRGVDIGAKRFIYQLIASLAAEGLAVLLISSELEELLGLTHRICVMRGGSIVDQFEGDWANQADILTAALGATAA